jgi:hypothetical protein
MWVQSRWMIAAVLTASFIRSLPLEKSRALAKIPIARREIPRKVQRSSVDFPVVNPQAADFTSNASRVTYDLELHDSRQMYQLTFSGRVSCGGHPCEETEIMVTVQMRGQTPIEEKTTTQSDGRYHLDIMRQALADEQLDWTITASGSGAAQETSGAHILTDVTDVMVQRDISL